MIAALTWWLMLLAVGLVGLPLALWLLRHLPDRGLGLARQVGLLAIAYPFWLLVSLGVLQNTTANMVGLLLVVAALGGWLWRRQRAEMRAHLAREARHLLIVEGLFAAAFLAFCAFRAYSADIAGTEKPMEFAFINGILRSRTFPPQDPWLAGYAISYYYLGYVVVALLTRLSGLASDVTFNLAQAMLFALSVSGAYCLGSNLVRAGSEARRAQDEPSRAGSAAIAVGLLAALLLTTMGNLVGVLEIVRARGWGSPELFAWFDVRNLQPSAPSRTWYPDDGWWWWRATRVIHDRDAQGRSQEVISEFPAFSFLLGDVHPHVLALPFVLLALGLALHALRAPPPAPEASVPRDLRARLDWLWPGGGPHLAASGLLLGALGFINTWDLPTYLGLVVLAYALWRARHDGAWLRRSIAVAGLLLGVSLLLYAPYYWGLRTQAGGLGLVQPKTQLRQALLMFAPLWALVGGLQLALTARLLRGSGEGAGVPPGGVVAVGGALLGAALWAAAQGWWTAALTMVLLAHAVVLLIWGEAAAGDEALGPAERLALLVAAAAHGLVLFCELLYLRDVFDSRMNTVFKFYYQAWTLLAIAGAYGAWSVWRALRAGWARVLALAPLALLVLGGLAYTVVAVPSRAGGFAGEPTLDGTRYVVRFRPHDYAAIQWLRAHAPQGAVMVEATGGSYTEFNWVSAHTGIPTLLGWGGHQLQWRGGYEIPGQREPDIAAIYQSPDPRQVRALLEAYGVDYVYVGRLERAKYGLSDATLQRLDRILARVYENDEVVIYGWGLP